MVHIWTISDFAISSAAEIVFLILPIGNHALNTLWFNLLDSASPFNQYPELVRSSFVELSQKECSLDAHRDKS